MNLLEEALNNMKAAGMGIQDVERVDAYPKSVSWVDFVAKMENIDPNLPIRVIFKDGSRLEHRQDAELAWWTYVEPSEKV